MTKSIRSAIALCALLVGALAYTAAAFACDGGHHNDGKKAGVKGANVAFHQNNGDKFRYTTTLVSPDKGCGDHVWANDTLKRTYIVKKNDDGSYRLTAFDRGTFTTVTGVSPQGCPTGVDNPHHGTAVTGGITGRLGGFLTENITGGTFNAKATCPTVCDRAAFVAAFFGPTAHENLDKNVSYLFVYMSKDASLKYHVWLDRGHAGATAGSLRTVDRGDIATA
jgi:hypothetical protein